MTLFSVVGFAQCSKGMRIMTPEKQFRADLEKNTLKLYTLGGFIRHNNDKDTAFREKYNITYHDFGCLAPINMEYYNDYNQMVFLYLKEKHGTEWEKYVRTSAMGLHKWKEVK